MNFYIQKKKGQHAMHVTVRLIAWY